MGDGRTDSTQREKREKARGPALIGARTLCLHTEKDSTGRLRKNWLDPGTGLVGLGAAARRRR